MKKNSLFSLILITAIAATAMPAHGMLANRALKKIWQDNDLTQKIQDNELIQKVKLGGLKSPRFSLSSQIH